MSNTRSYEARLIRNPSELSILDHVILHYHAKNMDDAENIACGFASILLYGEVMVYSITEVSHLWDEQIP